MKSSPHVSLLSQRRFSSPPDFSARLLIAIILNAVIFMAEFIGSLLTGSLALASDAFHNLSDFFALILSFVGARITNWRSNARKSYGYVRAEILVAFLNSVTLVVIGFVIIYEAVNRIFHPFQISGAGMLGIAVIGFVANTAGTFLLKRHAHDDLNLRSAFLHLMTDALESLVIVIGAILILWRGWTLVDPLLSISIGIFILKSAWDVLVEAVNIVMEGSPKGVDLSEVAQFMETFPGIKSVHHVHIWSLSSKYHALSAHIVVDDQQLSDVCNITNQLAEALEDRFGIQHPTLQPEVEVCVEQEHLFSK
ncbi:MAG: cation diffusion facilitator family transporter [Bacteroidota bacterium]